MKDYILTEKTGKDETPVIYKVMHSEGGSYIYRNHKPFDNNNFNYVGLIVKENKRGWSFVSFYLERRPKTVFLSRSIFTKTEI